MSKKLKTHEVLDLHYTPEEGQGCFVGTIEECEEFVGQQGMTHFMYKIVPSSTGTRNFIIKSYHHETTRIKPGR